MIPGSELVMRRGLPIDDEWKKHWSALSLACTVMGMKASATMAFNFSNE